MNCFDHQLCFLHLKCPIRVSSHAPHCPAHWISCGSSHWLPWPGFKSVLMHDVYSWPTPRHLNVKIDSNNWQQLLVHLQELLWVLIAKTFHTSLKLNMSLNVQYWPGRTEGELRECWQLGCSSSRVMTDKINIEITTPDDILSSPSPMPNPSPKCKSQILVPNPSPKSYILKSRGKGEGDFFSPSLVNSVFPHLRRCPWLSTTFPGLSTTRLLLLQWFWNSPNQSTRWRRQPW